VSAVCSCGVAYGDYSTLSKIGWWSLRGSHGDFGFFVRCSCGLPVCACTARGAALCVSCKRLITGEAGADPKIVAEEGILCTGCARRAGIGGHLAAVAFRAWVETGSVRSLWRWRTVRRVALSMPLRKAVRAE
jgi:hypothetical protein